MTDCTVASWASVKKSVEWLRQRTEYVPQLWNWENHS